MGKAKYESMSIKIMGRSLPQKMEKVVYETSRDCGTVMKPVTGVFVDFDGTEYSLEQLEDLAHRNNWEMELVYV